MPLKRPKKHRRKQCRGVAVCVVGERPQVPGPPSPDVKYRYDSIPLDGQAPDADTRYFFRHRPAQDIRFASSHIDHHLHLFILRREFRSASIAGVVDDTGRVLGTVLRTCMYLVHHPTS